MDRDIEPMDFGRRRASVRLHITREPCWDVTSAFRRSHDGWLIVFDVTWEEDTLYVPSCDDEPLDFAARYAHLLVWYTRDVDIHERH